MAASEKGRCGSGRAARRGSSLARAPRRIRAASDGQGGGGRAPSLSRRSSPGGRREVGTAGVALCAAPRGGPRSGGGRRPCPASSALPGASIRSAGPRAERPLRRRQNRPAK
eukprot:scaffold168444_cov31-Tisochrysis_lutea.AAC.1